MADLFFVLFFQLDDDLQTFLWGGTRIMAQLTTTGKLQTSRVSRKAALNTSHSCQCINFVTIRIVTKNIARKKIIHSLTLSLMTQKNLWPFFCHPFLVKTNWQIENQGMCSGQLYALLAMFRGCMIFFMERLLDVSHYSLLSREVVWLFCEEVKW